ncbi:MAG: peptidoglycan bridge formation glycyltransferase FemA/FemB family protein [Candidatus Woykebacteria bacterium]
MEIKPVTDEKSWEKFVLGFYPNNFLASWYWGDFHEFLGDKIFRLGLWEEKRLVGAAIAIKIKAKRGSFLLCPSGPLVEDFDKKKFEFLTKNLKELARSERVSFLRVRPVVESGKFGEVLRRLGFRPSPTHVHAQVSWLLDISKSEEDLLGRMRKSTRYLIKDAIRKDVRVVEKNNKYGLNILEDLQRTTVERHRFVPFPDNYLEKEFLAFDKEDRVKILVAEHKRKPLAAAIVVYYGDSGFYHHGASIKTKIPASYLLQWEAIKIAKNLGKKYYNFWGIAPSDSPNHPWRGLTYFKQGFGGFRLEYEQPQDLPLSVFYPVTYWGEKLRALYRGLN